jgi:hypothetical protein
MTEAKRFVIEGTWLGYRSSQDRVVHRTVHRAAEKRLRSWADKTFAITYTDGTQLQLYVRDCEPRERVKEIHGYDSLIRDCAHNNVNTVAALSAIEDARKAARSAP